jgi:hypothetical protein
MRLASGTGGVSEVVEWDFTLPSVTPELPGLDCEPAALPSLDSFRAIPGAIGDAMVYCIGCGEPMTLDAALAHGCPLPPAGRL